MKILQVMAGAPEGGAETAFVDFCIAQKESGLNVIAATRPNNIRVPALKKGGVPVYTFPFGGKVDMWTPLAMKQMIRKEKPQIIQTWMSRAAEKLPFWTGPLSEKPYRVVSRLGNNYKFNHFQKTDYFTSITPEIRQYLIGQGVHPDDVRHINNFAETEDIEASINRSEFQTPDDVPVLLTLSRLHEAKAIDILLKAMKDLPGVYLWIVGDGPLRGELEAQAQEDNLMDRVWFLGWRTDRAALLEAADILVFPSRFEPFGTTFVQAWANNIPLVCSDADGPRQFVKHEEDGIIAPKDNVNALKEAIERVLDDKDLAKKLVQNGQERYRNEFTKEKCLAAYNDFYAEILRRKETMTPVSKSAPA